MLVADKATSPVKSNTMWRKNRVLIRDFTLPPQAGRDESMVCEAVQYEGIGSTA
jgi:hypothetical protein